MANYVVIRAAGDLPEGFMPAGLEGTWLDLTTCRLDYGSFAIAVAVPSGRFETRDDGAVAEVWEVRP